MLLRALVISFVLFAVVVSPATAQETDPDVALQDLYTFMAEQVGAGNPGATRAESYLKDLGLQADYNRSGVVGPGGIYYSLEEKKILYHRGLIVIAREERLTLLAMIVGFAKAGADPAVDCLQRRTFGYTLAAETWNFWVMAGRTPTSAGIGKTFDELARLKRLDDSEGGDQIGNYVRANPDERRRCSAPVLTPAPGLPKPSGPTPTPKPRYRSPANI